MDVLFFFLTDIFLLGTMQRAGNRGLSVQIPWADRAVDDAGLCVRLFSFHDFSVLKCCTPMSYDVVLVRRTECCAICWLS